MKHIGIGMLSALAGYVLTAVVGYFLVMRFSSNTHDRQLEAGMTSAFVLGPLGGILAFIVGYLWSKNALP